MTIYHVIKWWKNVEQFVRTFLLKNQNQNQKITHPTSKTYHKHNKFFVRAIFKNNKQKKNYIW